MTRNTPRPLDRATEPVAAPRALGQRRRSRGMLAVAVFLIALGGVLAGTAYFAVSHTGSYLAVTRRVPAGTQLSDADLTVVQIGNAQDLSPVPASDRGQMVGKRTTVSLLRGQLLVREAVTDAKVLEAGQRQVGVKLDPGRMPADRLYPGDRVLVAETPDVKTLSGTMSTQDVTGSLGQWDATVVASSPPSAADRSTVLYLAVADADATQVGTLAAAGRLIVLLAGAR